MDKETVKDIRLTLKLISQDLNRLSTNVELLGNYLLYIQKDMETKENNIIRKD